MRREDVQPLLFRAADRLPEPDLADAAWAEGVAVRQRRRRTVLIGLVTVVAMAIIAAVLVEVGSDGNADITPPNNLPTNRPEYIPPSGQIAGIDFWVAPPPGSERFLDRLETPLGDRLQLPGRVKPLSEHKLDRIAAVVLAKNGASYEPFLLGSNASWSLAKVRLVPVDGVAPLSSGAISPDGRVVAFLQPGKLVTVDASTAEITDYDLPGGDLRSVSWLTDGQRILVSGLGVTYRVLVGEGGYNEPPVVRIEGSEDPDAATAPFRIETRAVLRYLAAGQWTEDSPLALPVQAWVGQTFSSASDGGTARLFVAQTLPQVPTRVSRAQVVAAISTLRTLPSRLLVLGEPLDSPPQGSDGAADHPFVREPGCCAVLGWYDEGNVLVRVHGWIVAWNLDTGRIRRVTELAVDTVALGPGLRP
ncbi:MAG TPA: hypothetical protein VIH10_15895 [Kribbella sp.]|jgi:hypothetical protein